ncbi:ester cyclase [Anaeromyxobacter terrae]|uniref:ester cyclase n=1 Tax=Anaeromyxobacter terrae TaxID=2925406 RepID=UPI001F579943|nr:ester cyclase [Anaeromyxobacter sp. SG22]
MNRWIEDGWQKGRDAVVDELHAPEFVDHDASGRPPDREGFKSGIRELYAAFPDFEARIEDMLVDASRSEAVVRWTATGTHRGAYLGVPPTGRRIAFKGIEILRFEGGWIVERWGEWDGLALLGQLGAR